MKLQQTLKNTIIYPLIILILLLCTHCGTSKKVKLLKQNEVAAKITLAEQSRNVEWKEKATGTGSIQQVVDDVPPELVEKHGKYILMNAVKDDESGEMIATDQLNAIVVEARFKNIAERNGFVDIAFNINVPKQMQDPQWQLRFYPNLTVLDEVMALDAVYITGSRYREAQLKGYERYDNFLKKIIPDSCDFINSFTYLEQLNIFLERNFRDFSRLRKDSTVVDSTYAKSLMGVDLQRAITHYTKVWLLNRNNRNKLRKDEMFLKYVKAPIIVNKVRLDSVTSNSIGDLCYHYVQPIKTRKDLRKVELVLNGDINVFGDKLYTMPQTEPLSFYISSMVSFTENIVRYMKKVVERRATVTTSAYLDFMVGKYNIVDTLHNNKEELMRIKGNIRDILGDEDFVTDSLVITAACSPEGHISNNELLAKRRGAGIRDYYMNFIQEYKDSINRDVWDIDLGAQLAEHKETNTTVRIENRYISEDWDRLYKLIMNDTLVKDKEFVTGCWDIKDLDKRERKLIEGEDYKYIRSVLYPYLRSVKFDFYLHRKGMVKDTIHTTEIDSVYTKGLVALQNRDYLAAIEILRPYGDFNTAVTYMCLDYNKSALQILEGLPGSAKKDYLMAVINAREGDEKMAVMLFLEACEKEPALKFRGNLDPEISVLIKKYKLLDQ